MVDVGPMDVSMGERLVHMKMIMPLLVFTLGMAMAMVLVMGVGM